MPRSISGLLSALVLSLVTAASASAQVEWPTPPENWWTELTAGNYPSATYDVNMGMVVTMTQTVQAVEGARITLATAVSMMGNPMPAQSQVIDATTLTPEGGLAMLQGAVGGNANPQAAAQNMNAMITEIGETTCEVGELELACTEYQLVSQGLTSRVWHAPRIPPIFLGGIVRAEATMAGISMVTSLSSYSGALLP